MFRRSGAVQTARFHPLRYDAAAGIHAAVGKRHRAALRGGIAQIGKRAVPARIRAGRLLHFRRLGQHLRNPAGHHADTGGHERRTARSVCNGADHNQHRADDGLYQAAVFARTAHARHDVQNPRSGTAECFGNPRFRLVFAAKTHLIHAVADVLAQSADLDEQGVQGFGRRFGLQIEAAAETG